MFFVFESALCSVYFLTSVVDVTSKRGRENKGRGLIASFTEEEHRETGLVFPKKKQKKS